MTEKKMNVESFNLDHTKVVAPYIRENGDKIYKYDIRFCQPNKEHLKMPSLHSLEHLIAELIRNHLDNVLDFGPMGCQTGFYLSVINNNSYEDIEEALAKTLEDVLVAIEVPACNEVQCGWAASHSLEGAQEEAKKFLEKRSEWKNVFSK